MIRTSHLTLILIILYSSAPIANTTNITLKDQAYLSFYAGVEGQLRYMPFNKDAGASLFNKCFPQGDVLLGVNWSNCLALEAGYESAINRHRYVTLTKVINNVPRQIEEDNTVRIFGPHVDLIGYYTLSPELNLIGTLGAAYLKNCLKVKILSVDGVVNSTVVKFSKTKWIGRIGGGLQYSLDEHVSIRGMVVWENTRRFRQIPAQSLSSSIFVEPKDSAILSFGILFNF